MKGHGFSRAEEYGYVLKGHGFSRAEENGYVLKGHGFSRAEENAREIIRGFSPCGMGLVASKIP